MVNALFQIGGAQSVLYDSAKATHEIPPCASSLSLINELSQSVYGLWRHVARKERAQLEGKTSPADPDTRKPQDRRQHSSSTTDIEQRTTPPPPPAPAPSTVTVANLAAAISAQRYKSECIRVASNMLRRACVHFGIHCQGTAMANAFGRPAVVYIVSKTYVDIFCDVVLAELVCRFKEGRCVKHKVDKKHIRDGLTKAFSQNYAEILRVVVKKHGTYSAESFQKMVTLQIVSAVEDLVEPITRCIYTMLVETKYEPLVLLYLAADVTAFRRVVESKYKFKFGRGNATDLYQVNFNFAKRMMLDMSTTGQRACQLCYDKSMKLCIDMKESEPERASSRPFAACASHHLSEKDLYRLTFIRQGMQRIMVPCGLMYITDRYDKFRYAVACSASESGSSDADNANYLFAWKYHQYFVKYRLSETVKGTSDGDAGTHRCLQDDQLTCSSDSFAYEHVGAPYVVLDKASTHECGHDDKAEQSDPACRTNAEDHEQIAKEIMYEYAAAVHYGHVMYFLPPMLAFHKSLQRHVPFVLTCEKKKVRNIYHVQSRNTWFLCSIAITGLVWLCVYSVVMNL